MQADVATLMAGAAADLMFTDPPYNVDYEGYTEERLKIKGDRMSDAEFKQFLEARSARAGPSVKPGASLYVCHSSSWQREFQNALEAAGFEVRCQIIWAKNTFAWGFGRYKFQHEPIFYCPCGWAEGSLVRRQIPVDALGRKETRGEPDSPDRQAGRACRARAAEQQQGRRHCCGLVRRFRHHA